jgi:HEAT repeats/HEAT repeat
LNDNHFLDDVNAILNTLPSQSAEVFRKQLAALTERGVNSYDTLFALLRDKGVDNDLLLNTLRIANLLRRKIDKRRVVFPLLKAIKSDNSLIRHDAVWMLGMLRIRRAVLPLMEIAENNNETSTLRMTAIQALVSIHDDRPIPLLRHLALNCENLQVRAEAIQQLSWFNVPHLIPEFIEMLSDESADVRFWAAYGLQNLDRYGDISAALSELDRVAAFDHTVPTYWGWHVDREALQALEEIYAQQLLNDSGEHYGASVHLISPAAEYDTFIRQHRKWQEDRAYETHPTLSTTLTVNARWLTQTLRNQFPDIELNIRQPKPQTYSLDWRLTLDGHKLIGGLHRDGYGVVLTGQQAAVYAFAAWYRSVISFEHPLYLYEWADTGVELTQSMTAKDVEAAVEAMEAQQRQPAKP